MTNGKCPTWFVVKWLTKHMKHTAKAPAVNNLREAKAYAGNSWVIFEHLGRSGWGYAHGLVNRSDWTIYDERGIPVEFKPKPKLERIGTMEMGDCVAINNAGPKHAKAFIADCKYDVLIRERRP